MLIAQHVIDAGSIALAPLWNVHQHLTAQEWIEYAAERVPPAADESAWAGAEGGGRRDVLGFDVISNG